MDWLGSLCKIEADFQEMSFSWGKGGERKQLMGDPTLCRIQSSWKATLKALRESDEGYRTTPLLLDAEQGIETPISAETEEVLL